MLVHSKAIVSPSFTDSLTASNPVMIWPRQVFRAKLPIPYLPARNAASLKLAMLFLVHNSAQLVLISKTFHKISLFIYSLLCVSFLSGSYTYPWIAFIYLYVHLPLPDSSFLRTAPSIFAFSETDSLVWAV